MSTFTAGQDVFVNNPLSSLASSGLWVPARVTVVAPVGRVTGYTCTMQTGAFRGLMLLFFEAQLRTEEEHAAVVLAS